MLYDHLRKAVCVSLSLAVMCGALTGFASYEEEDTAIDDITVVEESEESDGEVAIVPEEVVTDEVSIDPALGTDDDEGDELPIIPEGDTPITLSAHTIATEGLIVLNFKLILPDEFMADVANGAKILINGVEQDIANAPHDGARLVFSYAVPAAEIFDTVALETLRSNGEGYPMVDKNGVLIGSTFDYSVQEYIDYARTAASGNQKLMDLVNYLSEYGNYAVDAFHHETTGPVPAKDEDIAAEIDAITKNTPEIAALAPVVSDDGSQPLAYDVSTLELQSGTNINHYFTLASGADINNYKFVVDGKEVSYGSPNGNLSVIKDSKKPNRYVLIISGIPAPEIGTRNSIKVVVKSTGTEFIDLSYCAGSYIYTTLNKYSEMPQYDAVCKTVKALYLYYVAADAYFNG